MKVENSKPQVVQCFYHKTTVLPKGDEFSWQNCTPSVAPSATTIIHFIATAKINPVSRSSSAVIATISLYLISLSLFGLTSILLVLIVVRQVFFIMTMSTIPTFVVQIRSVIIVSLLTRVMLFVRPLCQLYLAEQISNGCAILFL